MDIMVVPHMYDGNIEMNSEGTLSRNDYMTMLVKFPSNSFVITNNNIEHDFNYYLNMANSGSLSHQKGNSNFIPIIFLIIFLAITAFFSILIGKKVQKGH